MNTTSITLLERLRSSQDDSAWRRFAELYTPMILAWSRRAGLSMADAEDLTQEVMVLLTREMRRFQYDPGRSFRAWLRTVAVNKCRELQRRRQVTAASGSDRSLLSAIEAPDQLDLLIEREHTSEL